MQTLAKYFIALLLFLFTQLTPENTPETRLTEERAESISEIQYTCHSAVKEIDKVI